MSQKVCVVTMQYGYVGMLAVRGGTANVANCHSRSKQFVLDPLENYSNQIFEFLAAMKKEADEYHNSTDSVDRGFGHILSHSITVIHDV